MRLTFAETQHVITALRPKGATDKQIRITVGRLELETRPPPDANGRVSDFLAARALEIFRTPKKPPSVDDVLTYCWKKISCWKECSGIGDRTEFAEYVRGDFTVGGGTDGRPEEKVNPNERTREAEQRACKVLRRLHRVMSEAVKLGAESDGPVGHWTSFMRSNALQHPLRAALDYPGWCWLSVPAERSDYQTRDLVRDFFRRFPSKKGKATIGEVALVSLLAYPPTTTGKKTRAEVIEARHKRIAAMIKSLAANGWKWQGA